MANISSKETLLHGGAEVTNWISQINAGGTVYDIATHHSITFKDGNGGAETVWNGLTDLEVVIPSIADWRMHCSLGPKSRFHRSRSFWSEFVPRASNKMRKRISHAGRIWNR
jgi:hypothetical protein